MVKIFNRLLISAVMAVIIGSHSVVAQPGSECDNEGFSDDCSKILAGYHYVRTYSGISKADESDYPSTNAYLFSKGTSYMITACDNNMENSRLVVNLYNQTRKLIASNLNEETGYLYDKIVYNCAATGIFYIQPIVEDSQGACGVSVLGFKKL